MISDFIWRGIAYVVSRPAVVGWLVQRAKRTPYIHITGEDGSVYMERYWLFNPYPTEESKRGGKWQFPISIRLHYIRREDQDRHQHDHPWNARTIILRGWYAEERGEMHPQPLLAKEPVGVPYLRWAGDTASLAHGEFHRISNVCKDGVWTMFITGKYRGSWGFKVDGRKVPWREYLGIKEEA